MLKDYMKKNYKVNAQVVGISEIRQYLYGTHGKHTILRSMLQPLNACRIISNMRPVEE